MRPLLTRYPLEGADDEVVAFSTTRHGGTSKGNYAEFNINEFCGDQPDAIHANRALLAEELGIDANRIIIPHQTHGTVARLIDDGVFDEPLNERHQRLEGVDAVFTNVPGVCVGVSTADCIPVLLYERRRRIVAAVHAGWRGTVARIVEHAIAAMGHELHAEPCDMAAWIGPGISLEAFEVGREVYDAFARAGFDMSVLAQRMPSASPDAEDGCRWHIDLVECNRRQLVAAGLAAGAIHVSGICTVARHADYFSARRLGINSGRIYSGIVLK